MPLQQKTPVKWFEAFSLRFVFQLLEGLQQNANIRNVSMLILHVVKNASFLKRTVNSSVPPTETSCRVEKKKYFFQSKLNRRGQKLKNIYGFKTNIATIE